MAIGLMLLAAGRSARLGRPKQLLPYRGRSLLRHAAEVAAASGCAPRVLVTGALHEELLPEVAGLGFEVVRNADWAAGMGGSIRAGLLALENSTPLSDGSWVRVPAEPLSKEAPNELEAVVVMLCDQPLLTPAILQALTEQFHATRQPVVACEYGGTRGVPALFGWEVFAELRALDGPAGARELLRRYAALPAVLFAGGVVDVDTAAQYQALP